MAPTEAEAAAAIRTEFGQFGAVSVTGSATGPTTGPIAGPIVMPLTRLGEGTDHTAFDVGGRYVFRFPKTDRAAARLALEARLTAWLAPQLPLAIPAHRFIGRPSPSFPRAFAGYPRLPGTPALLVDLARSDLLRAGRRMGTFLRHLHGVEVDEARALGLAADDEPGLEGWAIDALADLQRARALGHVEAGEAAAWERVVGAPPSVGASPHQVLHGDLAAEHVLLDEHGAPTAVIDWSDAVLGDPALDLAGLFHWGGEPLLASALETYGAVDAATLERARWLAACRALADIAFGEAQARREYVVAGQRALAWLREPLRLPRP